MNVSDISTTARRCNACALRKILWIAVFFFFKAQAKTTANTLIQNIAAMSYKIVGVPENVSSNTSYYHVDELLNFTLTLDNPAGVLVQTPELGAVLSYTLTNEGNGTEKFNLSVAQAISDDFDPTTTKIYLDSNNNSSYDTGTDLLFTLGVNVPDLSPDASTHIFLVSDVPASLSPDDETHMSLVVSPVTGSGPLLSVYTAGGDGGVDALMGSPGGNYAVEGKLIVEVAAATITKAQSILDPSGGNTSVQNSIITYTLNITASGVGTLSNVNILDTIPSGSSYIENSLRLDASLLTDATDSDAGVFTGSEIQVSLPTVLAPSTHTVTFQVRIL